MKPRHESDGPVPKSALTVSGFPPAAKVQYQDICWSSFLINVPAQLDKNGIAGQIQPLIDAAHKPCRTSSGTNAILAEDIHTIAIQQVFDELIQTLGPQRVRRVAPEWTPERNEDLRGLE